MHQAKTEAPFVAIADAGQSIAKPRIRPALMDATDRIATTESSD